MADEKADVEANGGRVSIPHWRTVAKRGVTTPAIENWKYRGNGTKDNPFVVEWIDDDPRNPMTWPKWYKWMITLSMAVATLDVALCSSMFSGGIRGLIQDFQTSQEVATLGLSLFVLGFAVGPLIWAPLSELYGRQVLFFVSFAGFTIFNAGVCASQNIWTVIILRFFAGSFGSSPLTNAGGVIADMFPARERGLAMSIFASAPFIGPCIGPVIGGFMAENVSWRWIMGVMALFSALVWFQGTLLVPETYAPVILRQRAAALSRKTGSVYQSQVDIDQGGVTVKEAFKTSLSRPWLLLFREPIVLLLSVYMAIVYGTLYLLFAAYPIVFQQTRGWSQGIGGLAFIAVLIGMMLAIAYNIFYDNKRYQRTVDKNGGFAPPEARLSAAMVGGIALPIGLFWFAWTNSPSLPWEASMAAGIPFGFGMVLVFLGIMNYLIDAYTIFAASALAANSVLRSCFGAAFPLFTTYMYQRLGIHWASTIPAFLALVCMPFPFLFYKYGATIRKKCRYANEAEEFLAKIRGQKRAENDEDGDDRSESPASRHSDDQSTAEKKELHDLHLHDRHRAEDEAVEAYEARQDAWREDAELRQSSRFRPINATASQPQSRSRSRASRMSTATQKDYEASPFDIDRVNSRHSFSRVQSRNSTRTGRAAASNERVAS